MVAKREVSLEWERVFSDELGGVDVSIGQAQAGHPTNTQVHKSRDGQDVRVNIQLSPEINGELGQLAQLQTEFGHLELDSFGLHHDKLRKLSPDTMNLIETMRVSLSKSEEYAGYRSGYQEIEGKVARTGDPVAQLMYNATQAKPSSEAEKRLFAMARRVNSLEGARRGDFRSEDFYREYSKYAAEVVRFIGEQDPSDGNAPGGDDSQGDSQDPSDNPMDGNGDISDKEANAANQKASNAQQHLQRFFAKHEDITGKDQTDARGNPVNPPGFGSLINPKMIRPRVEADIQELVKRYMRKLRMKGKKNKETGNRMNMRIASRAMFTGETKMYGAPAKTDIRNQRFVIVQDISGSMGATDVQVFGRHKSRIELAYHFGMGMKVFLEEAGARVEEYHYDDSPFRKGLTMDIGGGTHWGSKNMEMLKEWVNAGAQVIILTDGYIGFEHPEQVRELFNNPTRRPVGMQIGGGGSDLEGICPDWKDYTVVNDPIPALEAIVSAFARRFKF